MVRIPADSIVSGGERPCRLPGGAREADKGIRLVYYSLVLAERQDAYQRQWIRSIRSLRGFNSKIPVHLFVFNTPPDSLLDSAERYEVVLRPMGDYRDYMSQAGDAEGAALSCMPTLHKLLPLGSIEPDVSQVLFLDCDTFFFADVESLFDKYRDCDWYAREEHCSRRNVLFPYNPHYLDEDALLRATRALEIEPIPPYNSGVFLFNSNVRHALVGLRRDFLTYAWRLTAGASLRLDLEMPSKLRRRASEWLKVPSNQPIVYPSVNFWILDEIALWLTLGRIPNLSHGLFGMDHVFQGLEFRLYRSYRTQGTVAHYYSRYESLFLSDVGIEDASPKAQ